MEGSQEPDYKDLICIIRVWTFSGMQSMDMSSVHQAFHDLALTSLFQTFSSEQFMLQQYQNVCTPSPTLYKRFVHHCDVGGMGELKHHDAARFSLCSFAYVALTAWNVPKPLNINTQAGPVSMLLSIL